VTAARSLALAAAVLAVACVDIELRRIGPERPSRPAGCAVELVPDGRPAYDVVDVASGTVSCAKQRDRCIDEMRKQACVVGADVVYGFSERTESMYLHITATFAARAAASPSSEARGGQGGCKMIDPWTSTASSAIRPASTRR